MSKENTVNYLEYHNKKVTIESLIEEILNIDISKLVPLQRVKVDDKDVYVNTIELKYDSNNNLIKEQTFTKVKSIVFLGYKEDAYRIIFVNPFDENKKYTSMEVHGKHAILVNDNEGEPYFCEAEILYRYRKKLNNKVKIGVINITNGDILYTNDYKIYKLRKKIPMFDLETESGTYISSGVLSHNSTFGLDKDTVGGLVWKYVAYVRLNLRKVTKIKSKTGAITGIIITPQVSKNKITIPFRETNIEFDFQNNMINPLSGLVDTLISEGIIKQSGGWLEYNGEKFRKSEFIEFLKRNNDLKNMLGVNDDFLNNIVVADKLEDSVEFESEDDESVIEDI